MQRKYRKNVYRQPQVHARYIEATNPRRQKSYGRCIYPSTFGQVGRMYATMPRRRNGKNGEKKKDEQPLITYHLPRYVHRKHASDDFQSVARVPPGKTEMIGNLPLSKKVWNGAESTGIIHLLFVSQILEKLRSPIRKFHFNLNNDICTWNESVGCNFKALHYILISFFYTYI